MSNKELSIIGELMNNSYARARNAFAEKNPRGYQLLALKQTELKADFLTLNIDGTQQIQVKMEEMLAFLPDLIPAIQEVTSVPLSFDNPSIEYHKVALKHYDRSKSDRPILNSLAASRTDLDEMIGLVKEYDTNAIVMASEHFVDGGSGQCLSAADAYTVTKYFVERLITEAGRTPQQIIIDPGLAPVGADTYGLVNIGLDTMKRIREDKDLKDVHIMVSLSNFAWGTPKYIKHKLERAYLTLGIRNGLDFALANPEKNPSPLDENNPLVTALQEALQQGRAQHDESQETAGFRQAEAILNLCRQAEEDEENDFY